MKRMLTVILAIPVTLVTLALSPAVTQAATPVNHLVISEVATDQTGPNEFVELYNPTAAAIDVVTLGLKLHVRNSLGADEAKLLTFVPGRSTTIQPGGFYLIARNDSTYAASADATYVGAVYQLDDNGAAYISTSETALTAVIDLVGWGTQPASGFEGAAVATNPTAGQSLERLPGASQATQGNGTDTDNNAADFAVRTVAEPQSTVSATEVATADTAGPVVSITSPAANATVATAIPVVAGTITDTSGVYGANISVDGGAPMAMPMSGSSFSFQLPALADGSHTYVIQTTDVLGNYTRVARTITVDTVKPTLSVALPEKTSGFVASAFLTVGDNLSGVSWVRFAYDGALDAEEWLPFRSDVLVPLPAREGAVSIMFVVRDAAGNVSEVVTKTTTVTAPVLTTPTNGQWSSTGKKITLTWNPVSNAVAYVIRYTDGSVFYPTVRVTGTAVTIENLDPAKTYRFEVAAVSQLGATSEYTLVNKPEGTTQVAATSSSSEEQSAADMAEAAVSRTTTVTTSPTPTASPSPSPSPSPAADDDDSQVKADEDEQGPDWTRVVVALSILIIAAGVATGGWYLYQWWVGRPTDGNGPKGRW